jgi:hypothetical protein
MSVVVIGGTITTLEEEIQLKVAFPHGASPLRSAWAKAPAGRRSAFTDAYVCRKHTFDVWPVGTQTSNRRLNHAYASWTGGTLFGGIPALSAWPHVADRASGFEARGLVEFDDNRHQLAIRDRQHRNRSLMPQARRRARRQVRKQFALLNRLKDRANLAQSATCKF